MDHLRWFVVSLTLTFFFFLIRDPLLDAVFQRSSKITKKEKKKHISRITIIICSSLAFMYASVDTQARAFFFATLEHSLGVYFYSYQCAFPQRKSSSWQIRMCLHNTHFFGVISVCNSLISFNHLYPSTRLLQFKLH